MKNKKQLNVMIDAKLHEELKSASEKIGLSMAQIIELGIHSGITKAYDIKINILKQFNLKLEK